MSGTEAVTEAAFDAISADDAAAFLAALEPARRLPPSLESWESEFPSAQVRTPVGTVKLGANQFEKLTQRKRLDFIGMVKPTLERPAIVVEDKPGEKLFLKAFGSAVGEAYIAAVTIPRDGMEIVISVARRREAQVEKKLGAGRVLYRATALNPPARRLPSTTALIGGRLDPKPHLDSAQADDWIRTEEAARASAYGPNGHREPTKAMQDAGNYKKGRTSIRGISIAIEQPRGSMRKGVSPNGKPWQSRLAAHYGYMTGTTGADGDELDCFIGPWPEAQYIYCINQVVPGKGTFDECKFIFGAMDEDHAKRMYLHSYQRGWTGLRDIVRITFKQLRWWLLNGNTRRPLELGKLPHDRENTMDNATAEQTAALDSAGNDCTAGAKRGYWAMYGSRAVKKPVFLGADRTAAAAAWAKLTRGMTDAMLDLAWVQHSDGLDADGNVSWGEKDVTDSLMVDAYDEAGPTAVRVRWDGVEPVGYERAGLSRVLYSLRQEDAEDGLLLDAVTEDDIVRSGGTEAEGATFDALVVEAKRVERAATSLMRVLTRNADDAVKPTGFVVSKPMMRAGAVNQTITFKMADGQTLTIWFHNPDSTPRKLKPDDELVSWKWMLNRKDVTIAVAPERGLDLDLAIVARRIMALAGKNSAAFVQANAGKVDQVALRDALRAEVKAKSAQLEELVVSIESAKTAKTVSAIERAAEAVLIDPVLAAEQDKEHADKMAELEAEGERARVNAEAAADAAASVESAPAKTFLEMTPDEQRAAMKAEKAAVPEEGVERFLEKWRDATQDYAAINYRVVGTTPGMQDIGYNGGAFEMISDDGFTGGDASDKQATAIFDAIRGGEISIVVKKQYRGDGSSKGGVMTLHTATGKFKPFNYTFVMPRVAGAAATPTTKADAIVAMMALGNRIGESQRAAVQQGMKGEERQFFYDKMAELAKIAQDMPKSYQTDGQGDDAIAHVHYFLGGSDFYVTEQDKGAADDAPEDANAQAFGFTILNGDLDNAEMGYINIGEITRLGGELDFYWTPKSIGAIKKAAGIVSDAGEDANDSPAVQKIVEDGPSIGKRDKLVNALLKVNAKLGVDIGFWSAANGGEVKTQITRNGVSADVLASPHGYLNIGQEQVGFVATADDETQMSMVEQAVERALPAGEEPLSDGPITHAGFRIYKTMVNTGAEQPEAYWAVQSIDNVERQQRGEREVGGDALHKTFGAAKAEAEFQQTKMAALIARRQSEADAAAKRNEEQAAKDAEYADIGGAADEPAMQRARRVATLSSPIRVDGEVMTLKARVEKKVAAGALPRVTEVNRIKPMSRTAFNRASNEEQRAHEQKISDGGKVNEYSLVNSDGTSYEITKTEFDYAQHLIAKAAPQTAEPSAESVEPAPMLDMPETEDERFLRAVVDGTADTADGKATVSRLKAISISAPQLADLAKDAARAYSARVVARAKAALAA